MAALLWAGDGSFVSHHAAARLWRLDSFEAEVVEISCPRYMRSPVPWLIVHTASGGDNDTGRMNGLLVSTVHRTLLDLGAVVDADRVEIALESALRRRLTTIPKLRRLLVRAGGRGRRGAGVLRNVLGRRPTGAPPTASALETKAIQEIRRQSLPDPVRQFEVCHQGRFVARVDLAYPDVNLVVEVDSRRHHADDPDWARDLARRNRLVAAGCTVMHVTHRNLVADVAALKEVLIAAR